MSRIQTSSPVAPTPAAAKARAYAPKAMLIGQLLAFFVMAGALEAIAVETHAAHAGTVVSVGANRTAL